MGPSRTLRAIIFWVTNLRVTQVAKPMLNEAALRDPSRPVHRIADDLLPYLRALVEEFAPQHLILFGSYAYGEPDQDSDVDLLVVKPLTQVGWKEAGAIRRSWRPIINQSSYVFSFDLMVESPEDHRQRLSRNGEFYREINEYGVDLVQ